MGLRLSPIITALTTLTALVACWVLDASAVSAQQSDAEGEAAMVDRVNALRTEAGLPTLVRDARLDAAARTHSADMAWHQMLEHVSPRTGTPADRVNATGVRTSHLAENVAFNSSTTEAQAALEASEAHRDNMLTSGLTNIGVSVVFADGGVFVTQVFAAIDGDGLPLPPALPMVAPAPPPPNSVAPPAPAPPSVAPAPLAAIPPASIAPTVQAAPAQAGERRVTGYWVQWQGQWFYYPLPPGAQPGQRLAPDLSVRGGPGSAPTQAPASSTQYLQQPGYAVQQPYVVQPQPYAAQPPPYAVQPPGYVVQPGYAQPGYRVYANPRPSFRVQLGMPAPWAIQPRVIVRPPPRVRFRTHGRGRRIRRF